MKQKMNKPRFAAALVGSVALVGAGSAMAAPLAMAQSVPAGDGAAQQVEYDSSQSSIGFTAVSNVEGTFSYSQDAVSPNSEITGVFGKAVASLCASMPNYTIDRIDKAIEVNGPAKSFSATVDQMAESEGATQHIMACSCASNLPGGGAVINAEVEGVSLESVARMADVR